MLALFQFTHQISERQTGSSIQQTLALNEGRGQMMEHNAAVEAMKSD
jgi:hypothetical protein